MNCQARGAPRQRERLEEVQREDVRQSPQLSMLGARALQVRTVGELSDEDLVVGSQTQG